MEKSPRTRRNPRFKLRWPVLYGTDDMAARGTLLDLSAIGGRMAGTMPVKTGLDLWLRLHPPQRSEELHVEAARVTWVKEHEFGIELKRLPPPDHHWLLTYLEQAERRSTFRLWQTALPSEEEISLIPLSLPIKD